MNVSFFRRCGRLRVAALLLAGGLIGPSGAGAVSSSPGANDSTVAGRQQSGQPDQAVAAESYDSRGRRDPFQPYAQAVDRPVLTGAISPLQQYELSQLRLVAIVTDQTNPTDARAVLEDNSGLGYIITVGTPIGRTNGRVTAIEHDRIVVEEWPSNVFGERERVVVVKELDSGEEAMR